MILLLVLFNLFPQQLTWYERYERGEKQFERGNYEASIADINETLVLKPEPAKSAFTRAVQVIEYKPYYYLALAHHKKGDLPKAFEYAQRSYQGEPVRESPLLQSNLAVILDDYRIYVQDMHQQFAAEEAMILERSRLIDMLGDGESEAVARYLDQTDDPEKFKDIRAYLQVSQNYQTQLNSVQTELVNRIDGWLEQGDVEKAQSLFDSIKQLLPSSAADLISNRIAATPIPEPEPEPEIDTTPTEAPVEEDPFETVDPDLVEYYRQRLESVEIQKTERDRQIVSMEQANRVLQQQLDNEKNDKPSFEPQVFLSADVQESAIHIEGHAVSPLLIKSWKLLLNNQIVQLPTEAWTLEGSDLRINHALPVEGFGAFKVEFRVEDETGRIVNTPRVVFLETPLHLRTDLQLTLLVLILLVVFAFIFLTYMRRRKARLRHFNPYIAGSPVRGVTMFYGRDELLHRIQGLVHKNSFMIHGNRRIGKTSLLFQLKRNLSEMDSAEYEFYPAFIDLQGAHEKDLFHHMMAEILTNLDVWKLDPGELSFQDQNNDYHSRHFSKDIKKIIHLLKERSSRHIMVVLLMDEVDVLNEFSDKSNQKLRGIFMKDFAEHLTCVMAGIHLKKEWESHGSPWYNFFEEIPMLPFDPKAARNLVLDPVKGIFRYKRGAVSRIIEGAGGHPYLIQKICVSLIGTKLAQNRFVVTEKDAIQAVANLNEELRRNHI